MTPIRQIAALAVSLCISGGWSGPASGDVSPAKTGRPAAESAPGRPMLLVR